MHSNHVIGSKDILVLRRVLKDLKNQFSTLICNELEILF